MQTLTHEFANGDAMPLFGLGTWKSEPGEVGGAVRRALELGYRHIDCAPIYENEPEIGEAFADALGAARIARDDVWVTSKLWNNAHAPEDVIPALERTLADLRLERLDLYLIHWPVVHPPDVLFPDTAEDMLPLEEIPIADTWPAMEEVVDRGLTKHIGVSNFSVAKIRGILDECRIRPEVDQVEMHPYLQQPELVEFCRGEDILVTAYSPLGSPDRPDRLRTAEDPVLLSDPVVAEIARAHEATPAQVLITWALHRGTAVIPKTVSPGRLEENLAATGLELSGTDMERLEGLDRHRRYISGEFWAKPGGTYAVESLWDE